MLYSETMEIADSYYLTIRVHAKKEACANGLNVKEFFIPKESDQTIDFSEFTGIAIIGDTEDWYNLESFRKSVIASGLPVVFSDFDPQEDEIVADCVINDFPEITAKALNHFIGMGYKKIGYVGSLGYHVKGEIREDIRYKSFLEILKIRNLYNPDYVFRGKHSFAENGYELGKLIIARGDLPEAIFIENDALAIGLMRALKDNGILVPDQISLIGCNDIPTAKYLSPPLSSVLIHSSIIGTMSIRYLSDRIKNPRETGIKIIVPNELVLRQSCLVSKG